jgi:hypothetical protein
LAHRETEEPSQLSFTRARSLTSPQRRSVGWPARQAPAKLSPFSMTGPTACRQGPMVRIHFPPAESRANHRFLSGGAHVPHSRALRPRHLGDTRRGRTRRHGESVAQTRGQRQVGLLAAGEGGRLITTSGPKSAVVLESSLADNIASPANDIEREGLLRIANPNRRGRWQSCGKTALVSFGRSRR